MKAVCDILEIREDLVLSSGKSQKGSFARGDIAIIASKTANIPIEEMASLMNCDASTISSLLSRVSSKYLNSSQIQELIEKAKEKALEIAELQA